MICVSVGKIELRELTKILDSESLVELRLDHNEFSDGELKKICSSPANVIASCRPGKYGKKERLNKLEFCARQGAAYIDIELESGQTVVGQMRELTRSQRAKLIVSHHNFDLTPADTELENIYRTCAALGADIVKIACRSASEADNARLMSLYKLTEGSGLPPLIAIGMGAEGRITRAAAPFLGAPFTYASAERGRETADGQFSKTELKKIFQQITHG